MANEVGHFLLRSQRNLGLLDNFSSYCLKSMHIHEMPCRTVGLGANNEWWFRCSLEIDQGGKPEICMKRKPEDPNHMLSQCWRWNVMQEGRTDGWWAGVTSPKTSWDWLLNRSGDRDWPWQESICTMEEIGRCYKLGKKLSLVVKRLDRQLTRK